MGRRLRFHPRDSLVEVTCRTVQGRLLLLPTSRIADLCRGVLARAARLYPVRVHAFVFLGNHYHLLLSAPSATRLAEFMGYLNSNLAREVGRAVDWREKFWGRRYQSILVSNEEAAQVDRLLYILRHGCKENLVRRPADWPGAQAVENLLSGAPVSGTWVDRSGFCASNRPRRRRDLGEFVSREELVLAPLPCWSELDRNAYRKRIASLIRRIEKETERRMARTGAPPLGRLQIERQHPHRRPKGLVRRPAPLVHAASRAVREAFRDAYRRFVEAFRASVQRIRERGVGPGIVELFPLGSLPPSGVLVQLAPRPPS